MLQVADESIGNQERKESFISADKINLECKSPRLEFILSDYKKKGPTIWATLSGFGLIEYSIYPNMAIAKKEYNYISERLEKGEYSVTIKGNNDFSVNFYSKS